MSELIRNWDGEMVISQFDHPTGSWIFIGIHSSALGPAAGGTRMMHYGSQTDALRDCLKLSQGMTMKFALANFPRGGGKAVIATPEGLSREARGALLLRYGKLIKQLRGLYYTGPDIGTSSVDMDLIAQTAGGFVHSRTVENGGAGNSSELTAWGVYHAIRTTLSYLDGAADWEKRTVAIQGLGSVGKRLAELLLKEGARLVVSDINPEARKFFAANTRVNFVEPAVIYSAECDVFSPCALGGILNRKTMPKLRCRAVVGAANNQLAASEVGLWLHEKDILYAPDFAANAGGAMGITGIEAMGWSAERASDEVSKIGETVGRIYRLAADQNLPTSAAAEKMAAENLSRHRST